MRAALRTVAHLLVFAAISACEAAGGGAGESSEDLAGDASVVSVAPGATPGLGVSIHTTLGIPEAASTADPVHALLVKAQFVTSFDSTRKNPRWTSWQVATKWIGHTGRTQDFVPDRMLPRAIPQASMADYTDSGFDRGHICPSADRTDNVADNGATFVFTNCVPQTTASNTGTWETLEREERAQAEAGHNVFVTAGSIYEGEPKTIGNKVAVPSSMFKVVVILDAADAKPADVMTSTRVIAVEIPNTTDVKGDFRGYRVPFASLEAKTGFTFMSDVEKSVHDALAASVDAQ